MTVAMSLEQRRLDRAEQVEHLRRKIAAVSGKVGGGRRGPAPSMDPLPDSESLLPLPVMSPCPADVVPLAELLPTSLPRGTVAVLSGARSLPLSMVAAVTAEGGHAAIVGQPDVGLLAAVEMGADLSRIAVIPDPGADPVEVAAVLMDGMDLVVLGLGAVGAADPGAGGDGPGAAEGLHPAGHRRRLAGASARLDARVCGYEVTGRAGRPGLAGSARCDWPSGPGPIRRYRSRSGRMSVSRTRVLAIWCMDWPAVAAAAAAGLRRPIPSRSHWPTG